MLGQLTVCNSDHIGDDPVGGLPDLREAPVQDHVVALGYDQLVLVPKVGGHGLDQFEKAITSRRDVSAVLDVVWRPKAFRRFVVAFVE
jgi:hypothetical protein